LIPLNKKFGAALLFVLLLTFWIVLSFQLSVTIVIIGAMASALIVWYNLDLVFNDKETTTRTVRQIGRLLRLFVVLIYNIVTSNIQVARIVLRRNMGIDPGFVSIPNPLRKELHQAFFANAITLTPGTLTVDMDADTILIHSLIKEHGHKLDDSSLEKAFVALEEDQS